MRPISTRDRDNIARDIETYLLALDIVTKIGIRKFVKKCKSARHVLAYMPSGKITHEKIKAIHKKLFQEKENGI